MKVYLAGYAGWSIEKLTEVLDETNSILIDIRFSPKSKDNRWTTASLKKSFKNRYGWLKAFGNVDYKTNNIRLFDFESGLRSLSTIKEGKNVLLLCACRNAKACHRTYVGEQLSKRGYEVIELR